MSNQPDMPTPDTPQLLLEHHLKALRLPTILREYDKVARQCAEEKADFPRYLLRLTELELLDRDRRATERRIRQAKFPVVKTIDTFDFLAIPSANKTLVLDLARCEFLSRKENVLLLGNSGTGKTHLSLALGLAACQRGHRVRFTTASALVSELIEAGFPVSAELGAAAMIIAIAADLCQLVIFPYFIEGAFSPFDDALDLGVCAVLVKLLGWHLQN